MTKQIILPVPKQEFDLFSSDDITVGKRNKIEQKINERFSYIVETIFKTFDKKCDWYDYDNGSANQDDPPGYFDADRYKNTVFFTGEWRGSLIGFEDNSFPTKWLWIDDIENIIQKEINQRKQLILKKKKQTQQARQDRQINIEAMKKQIISKLTKEELKCIRFKK